MAFSVCIERGHIFCLTMCLASSGYSIRWKWEQQSHKFSLFANKCLWWWWSMQLQVIRSEIMWYCVVFNRGCVWWYCFAGGSKPCNGHGWVWLYEQCHEMSVQIRWPESVHVWMSCRWAQKSLFLFCFFILISPLLGHWKLYPFPFLRRCIQRRDWGPVWAPEANHQQLCVAVPGARRRGLPVGTRVYSGWAEVDGPRPLGLQDPQ